MSVNAIQSLYSIELFCAIPCHKLEQSKAPFG